MIKCLICGKEIKTASVFACHSKKIHNLSSQEYYDIYLKKDKEGFCEICGKQTNFLGIIKGYRKFCSCKCAGASKDILEKRKITNLKKYGVDNQFKRKDFQNIRTQTCLKKYGVDHASKSVRIKNKIKQTCLKKYGAEHISQSIYYLISRKDKWLEKCCKVFDVKILKPIGLATYNLKYSDIVFLQCLKCNTIFKTTFYNLYHECNRCPKCYPKGSSKEEKEIKDYIQSIYKGKIFINTRDIINPYELDIYLPELHLAIEYNGLYWHSEKFGREKNYHLKKLKMCLDKNIRLIQIFTDEWILNKKIVLTYLNKLIGLNRLNTLYARQCTVQFLDTSVKNEFLEKYHLQGSDKSKVNLGLIYKGQLVAVMTFSHGNIAKGSHTIKYIWELNRFCTKNDVYHIPGAASKLFTFFKKNYEWSEIFSYADRRWFTGSMYYKLGFKLEKETQPNYWYFKANSCRRIHRFSLRKRPDEPKDVPEWILRAQEGYFRVWDCGHLKFIIRNNKM